MMHSPCFRFPPIFEKILDFLENFKNVPFSRKNFPFSSAKISDDLFFSHRPQILDISPPDPRKFIISPSVSKISPPPFSKNSTTFYILYVYFPPYFDHDAFMHHPIHVLDAPA